MTLRFLDIHLEAMSPAARYHEAVKLPLFCHIRLLYL